MHAYTHSHPKEKLVHCCIPTWPGPIYAKGEGHSHCCNTVQYCINARQGKFAVVGSWMPIMSDCKRFANISDWVPTMSDGWHSPSGGQGVNFIKEDDAARQHLCSLKHLCQQALTLAVPLGCHSLQGNIHQRHRGLACYHPAHTIAALSKPLVLQDCFLRKFTGATTHWCRHTCASPVSSKRHGKACTL